MLAFVILALAAGTGEQPSEPLGYKNIKLGMTIAELAEAKQASCREAVLSEEYLRFAHGGPVPHGRALAYCLGPRITLDELPPSYLLVGRIKLLSAYTRIHEGKVGAVFLALSRGEFPALRAALTEKYGAPTDQSIEVLQNKLGAKFESEVLTWKRPDGWIRLRERTHRVDISGVDIISQPYADTLRKQDKSGAKGDAKSL